MRTLTGVVLAATVSLYLALDANADFSAAEEFGAIFDSTASEARRIEPGKSYVVSLPEHRRACVKTAYREFGRGGYTAGLVMQARLLAHCYLAIISRLEELYYKPPDRPETSIAVRVQALSTESYNVFHDIYWSTRQCAEQPTTYCGTMHSVLPYDDYLNLVTGIMDAMAAHVAREVDQVPDFDAWKATWDAAERFPK